MKKQIRILILIGLLALIFGCYYDTEARREN